MAEEDIRKIHIEDGDGSSAAAGEEAEAESVNENAGEAAGAEAEAESANETAEDHAEADAEAEAKAAEEKESERFMRLMAEFQNFKRRAAREKSDIHAYANEKIVGELLPVLDNFERALQTEGGDLESYAKGMELIFTQLKTALEHAGLAEIPALGEEFDPNVHNAVMTEQSEEHEDGKISKVLQKGYKLNDKVIRPSMVAVVRK